MTFDIKYGNSDVGDKEMLVTVKGCKKLTPWDEDEGVGQTKTD